MKENQYYTTSDNNIHQVLHSSNKYKKMIRIIANSCILSLLVELIPMFIEMIVIAVILTSIVIYCKTCIQLLLSFIFIIITVGISTYIFSIIDTKLGEINNS